MNSDDDGIDLNVTLRADGGVADIAPHYYVKPTEDMPGFRGRMVGKCARKGCGCPPQHPVHLRPAGDDPVQGLLATGTG